MEALVLNRSRSNQSIGLVEYSQRHELTVTGHAWLARNTGGDKNDLSASEGLLEALSTSIIALDLYQSINR